VAQRVAPVDMVTLVAGVSMAMKEVASDVVKVAVEGEPGIRVGGAMVTVVKVAPAPGPLPATVGMARME